jgi:hypothetical protein
MPVRAPRKGARCGSAVVRWVEVSVAGEVVVLSLCLLHARVEQRASILSAF